MGNSSSHDAWLGCNPPKTRILITFLEQDALPHHLNERPHMPRKSMRPINNAFFNFNPQSDLCGSGDLLYSDTCEVYLDCGCVGDNQVYLNWRIPLITRTTPTILPYL